MRRVLPLALGVCSLAYAATANAQGTPVYDATAVAKILEQTGISKDTLQNIEASLQVARDSYTQLVQTYQQITNVYNSLAHLTAGNAPAAGLGLLQNPLPLTSSLPGSISGANGIGGDWSGWAQQYRDYNVVYLPPGGDDFVAQQLAKNANTTANIQAVATQNMQALEARAGQLPDIQTQIDRAATLQDMQAINSRLGAERNFVQNQQAQAANLTVIANAQAQAAEQAQQQGNRQQLDEASQSICSTLSGLGSGVPVSSLCTSAAQ